MTMEESLQKWINEPGLRELQMSELFEFVAGVAREEGEEALIRAGWKKDKCPSCGMPIWVKTWYEPPSCPECHASRVD